MGETLTVKIKGNVKYYSFQIFDPLECCLPLKQNLLETKLLKYTYRDTASIE